MACFFVKKVLKCLLTPRPGFDLSSNAVIAHGHICCVALLLWSASGALGQDIPSGFRVDRYVRVWERNPFIPMKTTAPERLPSAFEKLFLASWLKDGGKEVVLVQNSESNELQRITGVPNQNNLRLVEMHPNPNPQFVEVVISDGKEQGTVKFRFDVQPSMSQTPIVAAGQASNQVDMTGGRASASPASASPASLPSSQSQASSPTPSDDQVNRHRINPGAIRVHTEGGPGPTTGLKETQRKYFSPNSAAAQSAPGWN